MPAQAIAGRPLAGRRVVTTRDTRGALDSALAALGADVVHIPLIAIEPAPGRALSDALDRLGGYDWLVVSSRHGARAVGDAARRHPGVSLAAVGAATAAVLERLAGRPVEIVPGTQSAAGLVEAMPAAGDARRALVAQADRAEETLVAGLRGLGYEVDPVVAYVTSTRTPSAAERRAAVVADAVAFASGSAAGAWSDAFGASAPPVVAAIGSTTAAAAEAAGLAVTHVATRHDVDGLVEVIATALGSPP
ncbi:MAG: uroporphyrinogen-III synthase [Ilumatobacter sp.]|uniref:uroporphyrinogen-III synthase n=1 Tax=Ilumatobacter sp. TaxID=1967498 RepID=UPI00263395DB|nr:uroporphyrinogen-III synthase [Ilumatobacter sp.]MDJ0767404.1 uroporphyrinogen-III synthase [Ilumatobacter sp.]